MKKVEQIAAILLFTLCATTGLGVVVWIGGLIYG